MYSGNIIVPIPQRISSLLRLGDIVEYNAKGYPRNGSANRRSPFSLPPIDRDLRRDGPPPGPHAYDESRSREIVQPNSRHGPDVRKEENMAIVQKSTSIPRNLCRDVDTPSDDIIDFSTQYNLVREAANKAMAGPSRRLVHTHTAPLGANDIELRERDIAVREGPQGPQRPGAINLRGRSHVSLRGYQAFSLARSHPRQPVARDWSDSRKRFVASVACISTALIGVLIGIYAGLVPSIQYFIADLSHYAILGNVLFYFGLAIPSFLFWPLPLLHGRKPYILSGLVVAMPLLFPQAVSVGEQRSPYTSEWR